MRNATPASASVPGTILVRDCGQLNTVACASKPATAQVHFSTLTPSRAELVGLFAWHHPTASVIEACPLTK
jgi:hypothetical protein